MKVNNSTRNLNSDEEKIPTLHTMLIVLVDPQIHIYTISQLTNFVKKQKEKFCGENSPNFFYKIYLKLYIKNKTYLINYN